MKGKKELKKYKVGDRSKGCCTQCGLVETVFKIRDLPIGDEEENVVAVAKGILVGVCTKCGKTITTPQQSSREIREALEKGREVKTKIVTIKKEKALVIPVKVLKTLEKEGEIQLYIKLKREGVELQIVKNERKLAKKFHEEVRRYMLKNRNLLGEEETEDW